MKAVKGKPMLFICPKCSEKLNTDGSRLVCPAGHSFDRAKEGYFNLLLSSGGVHGDNKEMVLARRTFLSRGYYRPLADALCKGILGETDSTSRILDCGSGEGYYTDLAESSLYERDGTSEMYAFDISKDAVKASAKKNRRISFAVASAYHQPFADCSFDLAYNVFSPLAAEEVHRILKPSGIFIMAIPDEEHLYELKSVIYDTPYKNTVESTELPGFSLISNDALHYTMHLESKEDILSLFKMTPYAYRTRKENADRILALDSLAVSAHFRLLKYKKVD